jgi:1-acyl-sn-glycerol-3-phosphate acyltransferase
MAAPRHYMPARDGYWDGFAFEVDPAFPALAADIARHRQQAAAGDAS